MPVFNYILTSFTQFSSLIPLFPPSSSASTHTLPLFLSHPLLPSFLASSQLLSYIIHSFPSLIALFPLSSSAPHTIPLFLSPTPLSSFLASYQLLSYLIHSFPSLIPLFPPSSSAPHTHTPSLSFSHSSFTFFSLPVFNYVHISLSFSSLIALFPPSSSTVHTHYSTFPLSYSFTFFPCQFSIIFLPHSLISFSHSTLSSLIVCSPTHTLSPSLTPSRPLLS